MSTAVYPGSFDPITLGHLDIIQRLCSHYDKIVILIANNPQKTYLFSLTERVQLARDSLKEKKIENIKPDTFQGLTVNYAKIIGASVIVRGIRSVTDFEYEMAMSHMNKKLCPEVETMMIFASPDLNCLSSKMVKEVAIFGGRLQDLVPTNVAEALSQKKKMSRA